MSLLAAVKSALRPVIELVRRAAIRNAIRGHETFDAEIRSRHPAVRMSIFVTSICTARCVFCPQHSHEDPKAVMENDLFFRVTDQFAAAGGITMSFVPNNGDPLVDPRLGDKLRYASGKGIPTIMLVTNGILLTRGDIIDALLAYVTDIRISLPGLEPETYRRVYGVDKAAEVLAGVLALARRKRELGSRTPINLCLRLDRPIEDVKNDEAFRQLDPYLADGTLAILESEIFSDTMDNWSGAIKDEDLPGLMKLKTFSLPAKRRACRRLFWDITVLPDGKMRLCGCRYLRTNYDDLVVGDLAAQPLAEVFFGPAHRELLGRVASGDWPTVCENCSFYEPINYTWGEYAHMLGGIAKDRVRRLFSPES